MHQVHLNDQAYEQAMRLANAAGFESVDEFITDVLTNGLGEQNENQDHLFTPEKLAHIERVRTGIKAGEKTFTQSEIRDHFRKKWESWTEPPAS